MSPSSSTGGSVLVRRARLGLAPSFGRAGVVVEALAPGGAAERAGLRVGDTLLAIGGVPVQDAPGLRQALRQAATADEAALRFVRDGVERVVVARVELQPTESIAGAELSYEALPRDNLRLRRIVSRPVGAFAPTPAVVLLQGLGETSCEVFEGSVEAALIEGLARAGCAAVRVERRGVGDSEGALEATDLETELGDLRAAIEGLRQDPRIDPSRIWLYGHSLGGMMAPLLLREDPGLAGCVAVGTTAVRWRESVREAAVLQHGLRGLPPDRSAALIASELARYDHEAVIDGRPRALYLQLEGCDLEAAWLAAQRPVLVLAGEYDWVTSPARGREIVELVRRGGGPARFVELAGCDHTGTTHPNRESSVAAYGQGPPCTELVRETVAFVAR